MFGHVYAKLNRTKHHHNAPLILHIVAIVGVIMLSILGYIPWLTVFALIILLTRALYFLRRGTIIPAKILGIQEIIFGLLLVSLTAIGYAII
jgi:hypothetical protein